MQVVTTLFTEVSATISANAEANISITTITLAPESFSWCFNSRGVYIGLVLTTVRPARSTPKIATGY